MLTSQTMSTNSNNSHLLLRMGFCLLLSLANPFPTEVLAESGPLMVVVTGTRTERAGEDAPVRTEVVSRQEIEDTHARTLKEALENIPGLQLSPIHGKAGYEASLQGLSGEQVLVLIDGLPLTASTGSTVDLSQLSLTDVERIEVVKGAMSAQYGSAAMGGVINVITRRIQPELSGSITLDAGSYGDQNPSGDSKALSNRHGQFHIQGGSQQWRLRLAGDVRNSDGVDPDPDTWPVPGDAVDREQFILRGEWIPDARRQAHASVSHFNEKANSRYLRSRPGRDISQEKLEHAERLRMTAGGEWTLKNGLHLVLNAADEQFDDRTLKYAGNTTFDDRRAELGLTHITALAALPAIGKHILQLGTDYHAESLGQTIDGNSELQAPGKVTRDSREVFIHDDVLLSDSWELLLGLRYQDDSDFGSHSAPKANLRGHLLQQGDWTGTLRVGWGEGYRVPNLKERHYLFDHSNLGYVVIGNPDLQPETSSSWQLGWRMAWRRSTWLDINLFDNRLHNLIQVDEVNAAVINGITQFEYENLNRARTRGAELGGHWQPTRTLGLSAGYTYMRTRNEDSHTELTRRPKQQARLGMDWQFLPRWRFTSRTRYQSSELVSTANGSRSASWKVLDVALNYDWSEQLRLFTGIDNLGHEQRDFTDTNDFRPVEGRFFYAGLRYDWRQP